MYLGDYKYFFVTKSFRKFFQKKFLMKKSKGLLKDPYDTEYGCSRTTFGALYIGVLEMANGMLFY
jgi:hypothetical protein